MRRFLPAFLLLLGAAACSPDRSAADGERGARAPEPPPPPSAPRWESAPREGVRLREGRTLLVETGPHVVLWPAGQGELAPPYTVRARLHKRHGRVHEGYGIVVGGSPLDAPEASQRYTYFLVRGDGSYLIKRRIGPETPVVRPWTFHPAIRRDTEEGGSGNALEVRVEESEVVFLANGVEVARVPAAEVDTRGVPGIRAAHDVQLEVESFEAGAGEAAP